MMKLAFGCALASSLVVAAVGCSAADDPLKSPVDTKPSCTAIIEACHPLDKGPGAIHECHEAAEADDVTEAKCAAQKPTCLMTCKADAKTDGG